MSADSQAVSFYFFDFDDNIMFLSTPIFILNTATNEERAVGTGEFASIHPQLGQPGPWEDYAVFDGSYRNFRDVPTDQLAAGQPQQFVQDVQAAIDSDQPWKAPSWDLFVHACAKQRPVSIVTARGHQPETLKAGVQVLVQRGLIPQEPNYHTIFPVGNNEVRQEQLGDERLIMTTPALKKRAIVQSVEKGLQAYGSTPAHRFGMSDDDPKNVDLIISAMCQCKQQHEDKRFFVINTHFDQKVKLEIFPVNFAVTGNHDSVNEVLDS